MARGSRTITIELDGIGEDLYRDLMLSFWMQTQAAATASNFRFKVLPDGPPFGGIRRELDKLWDRYGKERERWER